MDNYREGEAKFRWDRLVVTLALMVLSAAFWCVLGTVLIYLIESIMGLF